MDYRLRVELPLESRAEVIISYLMVIYGKEKESNLTLEKLLVTWS